MKSTRLRRVLTGLVVVLIGLAALEGASSFALFVRDVPRRIQKPAAERRHTEHDPDLGWRHRKGFAHPALYGPGLALSVNSQGLRAKREFGPRAPGAPTRVVCLGDSFTLGYGVGDDDTWPACLERQLPGVETVNMGQGGYGLDQDWLWYRRDGVELDHDLVLFAFIADDLRRLRTESFLGYPKPLVRWRDGELAVTRTPVPAGKYDSPWLTQNLPLLAELRTVALGLRLAGRDASTARADKLVLDDREAELVALGMFADLDLRTRDAGRRLALVVLPSLDPRDAAKLASLPDALTRACAAIEARGVPVIDLHARFEALEREARRELFLLDSALTKPGAEGHYSPRGNAFVANQIARACAERGLLPAAAPDRR